jgi:hypothetical protein
MEQKNYIAEYFTNSTDPTKEGYWRPRYLDGNQESLKEYDDIVAEIKDSDLVIDVGCGYHPFKGRIKNLIGIDKYNPTADIVVDLLDYDAPENHFDVVISLGATNLESFELISQQIERLVYWCKPGGKIYMRVNPVLEEVVSPKKGVCKWTIDHIAEYTRKHDLEIIKPVRLTNGLRYIFTWQKQK